MKNKILITGGAGFIGSHLVDYFVKYKHKVVVVDDLSTGNIKNIEGKRVDFHKLDIGKNYAKKTLVQLLKNVDYVFHLAAIPRTQYCVENPEKCNQANVNGTLNLLEACRQSKIKKLIHASSCGIYGPNHYRAIKETDRINLGTPYAVQKYVQELYIKLYTDLYNIPSVILRYFNVYGTKRQSEKGSYPNVLASFLRAKKKDGKIYITGNGKQSRDMVHVYDVVRANVIAMRSRFKNGEVFNIGTGRAITVNEMGKYFNCPIEYIEPRPGEAFKLQADTKKVETLLKWKAKIDFARGIKIYLKS